MKILISAPTGIVGRKIVPELLAPEFFVRVITGDPSRIPEEIREQVDIVHGAASDSNALRVSLEGIDAFLWCAPGEPIQKSSAGNRDERFARAASQAISEAGTPRVVAISTSPAAEIEDILNESGAAVRHLRCGLFMEIFLQKAISIAGHGLISFPLPPYIPIPMIAARDIADVALKLLVRKDWSGVEALSVRGADDISLYQTAALIECIWGRPVRYEEVTAGKYLQTQIAAGVSADYAKSMLEMFSVFTGRSSRPEAGSVRATPPTTLTGWLRSELLPLLSQFEQQKEINGAFRQISERKITNKRRCQESHPNRPQFFENLLT